MLEKKVTQKNGLSYILTRKEVGPSTQVVGALFAYLVGHCLDLQCLYIGGGGLQSQPHHQSLSS